MKYRAAALVTLLVLLTACAAIRSAPLNPLNWFGPARAAPVAELVTARADPRALVAQVTELTVELYPGGALIRATGLPPSQGFWQAELVRVETADTGALVYDFRIFPPPLPRPAGTPQSREVVVAISASDIALDGIARITVQGADNALTSAR